MSACTFFGHRECWELDAERLRDVIEGLIQQGVDTFYVGDQGGFDAMVYSCLKGLRKAYPHICVSVVLAYLPTGEMDLPDAMYPEIEGHPKFAITRRNRWMIDHADVCVCYIDHTWGGAYKSAVAAKRHGLRMIGLGRYQPDPSEDKAEKPCNFR